jgi:hypothetical protein
VQSLSSKARRTGREEGSLPYLDREKAKRRRPKTKLDSFFPKGWTTNKPKEQVIIMEKKDVNQPLNARPLVRQLAWDDDVNWELGLDNL